VSVDPAQLVEAGRDGLPGLLGIEVEALEDGRARMRLPLRPALLAPNGFLHAGTVVALADTACGYGCVVSLPQGGTGFTTIELKSNFLATAHEGALLVEARCIHSGRTTQVWDATVSNEAGKTLALFRCTQLVLYDGSRRRGSTP
jgi:1,4-dihydroxy-2-naphthoyl-CoA hydrolase